MVKFHKVFRTEEKKLRRDNLKKVKEIGNDVRKQMIFAFSQYVNYLDIMSASLKLLPVPEDQGKDIVEKTASLKEAVEEFMTKL
jgi:hypothetical protein